MKELTIKKETLDVVRQMVADGQVSQEVAEKYFPELRESESERIRKALKEYFINSFQNNGVAAICGVHIIDILAWLEKQGESYTKRDVDDAWLKGMCDAKRELEKQKDTNVFDVPKISIKDAIEVTSRMQYIEDDMKPIAEFIMDYASWNLHKDEWNQPVLEVPLFRVLDALIQRGKPYCECGQNIEKQGEQKLFDYENANIQQKDFAPKVEPKFKVKYAGSEYNVLEVKDVAGVTYYGIEDEPNHIDYVKAENCEIIDGYVIKENGSPYPTKSAVFFGAKNTGWSEMDEMNLEDSMRAIKCSNYFDFESAKENVLNWLKSLKERLLKQTE